MPTDVLPLKVARRTPPPARELPDPAVAALPMLTAVRDTLRAAARFRAAFPRPRFGSPPLFFFHPDLQADLDAGRPGETVPDAWAVAGRREPAGARAWADLFRVVADALPVLAKSVDVRHAGRAVPGLTEAAAALAPFHAAARELAEMLALADDVTVLVIDPAGPAGVRVRVRGIADLAQFHVLLAEAVTGDPADGLIPGPRPDAAVLDAYRDGDPANPPVATARFQMFRPEALRPDGTVPPGFSGCDDWLWGETWLTRVPVVRGERAILVGDPAYPAAWEAVRKVPSVAGELDVAAVLPPAAVRAWVAARTGGYPAVSGVRRAA